MPVVAELTIALAALITSISGLIWSVRRKA